eukprot:TRINITY_DN2981_c0_g1_i3.p2 TRINITY_DN2981_c0_g1~~TRINITY_DN2981_c0_g1_i3.p2  ORF type:complete len:127 (+),score=61.58 TRINITY_DN2981_c0_g1_i3:62-442(+)
MVSPQASCDLIWRVVKGNNAFLKKQRFGRGKEGVRVSTEASNVAALSTFKYSGVAHAGTSVNLAESGLVVKRGSKKNVAVSVKKAGQAARTAAKGRKDLKGACKARAARMVRLVTRKQRKSWNKEN